jgi:NAD(P)-dependent dehydrogenase (short-subunit alcohol dehydrogenase family)
MGVDRIAVVTGAGRGIGRASALALAAQGHRVLVTARSRDELEAVVLEIESTGGTAMPLEADLADPLAVDRVIGHVEETWGSVEVLVNNAGIGSSQRPLPLVDFDDAFWDLTFAVNVTAPYRLTKRVLPGMLQDNWGRIINIASINARVASLHGAAYTASKHALAGLTKATAKEVEGTGITANAVCPGVTATRLNDKRLEYDANRLGKSIEQLELEASPLGRRISPQEVAFTVAFLANEQATAINGQMINVCGGRVVQ